MIYESMNLKGAMYEPKQNSSEQVFKGFLINDLADNNQVMQARVTNAAI